MSCLCGVCSIDFFIDEIDIYGHSWIADFIYKNQSFWAFEINILIY